MLYILTITVALLAVSGIAVALKRRFEKRKPWREPGLFPVANDAAPVPVPGTHPATARRQLDADITTHHLIVTQGAAGASVKIAGAADLPLGVVEFNASAGEFITVHLFGKGHTKLVTASGVIAAGAAVVVDAGGKAKSGTGATSGYIIGIALTPAAAAGDVIEIADGLPQAIPAA